MFPRGSTAVDGRPDLERVMAELGRREITSLIIEGGAMVNWAALAAGIVDKIFFYYAPKILAGTGSIPFATGAGYRRISEAASVKSMTLHRFGEDFAVEGYLGIRMRASATRLCASLKGLAICFCPTQHSRAGLRSVSPFGLRDAGCSRMDKRMGPRTTLHRRLRAAGDAELAPNAMGQARGPANIVVSPFALRATGFREGHDA